MSDHGKKILAVHFGALAAPLLDQIKDQGFVVPWANAKKFQNLQGDADAVTRLAVRAMLGERAAKAVRLKILAGLKKIVKVKAAAKEEPPCIELP